MSRPSLLASSSLFLRNFPSRRFITVACATLLCCVALGAERFGVRAAAGQADLPPTTEPSGAYEGGHITTYPNASGKPNVVEEYDGKGNKRELITYKYNPNGTIVERMKLIYYPSGIIETVIVEKYDADGKMTSDFSEEYDNRR
jgi:hypothetical protein